MFNKIDIATWDRAERYNHFMNWVPCDYNITANIDIAKLLKTVKEKKAKLYPALIYMLGVVVNDIKEMRLAINADGELGYYDICHPSYTIVNSIDTSFSGIWSWFKGDFCSFYQEYTRDVQDYSTATAYAPKANQPCNTFYVSCAPEVAFTSLSMNLYNGEKILTPMFTFGKFFSQGESVLIPLAAHLHHAACDGYHVAQLYKKLQQLADTCDTWLVI